MTTPCVIAVDGLMAADLCVLEAIGLLLSGEQRDILAQGPLIALERQHVIGLLVEDLRGDGALAGEIVSRDVRARPISGLSSPLRRRACGWRTAEFANPDRTHAPATSCRFGVSTENSCRAGDRQ
jgi:hypothetical protein